MEAEAPKGKRKYTKRFAPESISSIIEACAKCGVMSLKWHDLEVTFAVPGQPVTAYDLPKTTFDGYASPASEQELAVDPRVSTVDKELLEDMRRSQLMIDDPLSYEQEVIDAHIRRGESNATI